MEGQVLENLQDVTFEKPQMKTFMQQTLTHKHLWNFCFCGSKSSKSQFYLEQKINFFGLKLVPVAPFETNFLMWIVLRSVL